MKNRGYLTFIVVFSVILCNCKQKVRIQESSFTAVNPLSYTDVVFLSDSDTVLVSTFNGRIAKKINGQKKEALLIHLADEIYSMAYDRKRHRLYAATLNSGIAIIDTDKKTALEYLPVKDSWISDIYLSKDGNLLAGHTANRQIYIWDLKNNESITIPENFSNYRVTGIDVSGNVIFRGNGKYIFWDLNKNSIKKEITVSGNLADIDALGNMLLFYDKNFRFYSAPADSVTFSNKHNDWPYYLKEQDTVVRIPLHLALTVGVIADQFIFTAGIDRSIRKWDKTSGRLVEDIIEHKATISAIKTSPDQSQIVSVDLKGGVLFSGVNNPADKKE